MTDEVPTPVPTAVGDALHMRHGPPVDIVPLGGMSGARVYRVEFSTASAVVKAARTAEARFYERVAPTPRERGVPVPVCQGSLTVDDDHWLILEDIPWPLPRDRWHADPAVLAVLGRLHATTWGEPLVLPGTFVPGWTDEMTATTLSCVPAAVARDLAATMGEFQQESQELFRPLCAISGDPNPTNWGLRADGTAVLYDWERCGGVPPPLDLAITVPGLGNWAAYASVVRRSLNCWPGCSTALPWTPERWVRAFAVANLWSVVEFLHGHVRRANRDTGDVVAWIAPILPGWVREIATMPRTG